MRINDQPRYKTLGLREFRRLSGKTLREVALEAGVSAGFVSNLEAGRMEARPDHVEAIALAVYVEPDDLLGTTQELEDKYNA